MASMALPIRQDVTFADGAGAARSRADASTSPDAARARAALTAPTARTVWTCPVGRSPLTEIGASPMPNAHSMWNWPGTGGGRASDPAGRSVSVAVASTSTRRPETT